MGESKFGHSYISTQGKQLTCYLLPKREFNLVISGYSVPHRLALIDRLEELEAKAKKPALNETQEALLKVIALFKANELAMVLDAFVPKSIPDNCTGIR